MQRWELCYARPVRQCWFDNELFSRPGLVIVMYVRVLRSLRGPEGDIR